MPYIADRRRTQIAVPNPKKGIEHANTEGELNYLLTQCAIQYINHRGLQYSTINAVEGAFYNAAQEFYRRVAAPYEDRKIKEQGDVYGPLFAKAKLESQVIVDG